MEGLSLGSNSLSLVVPVCFPTGSLFSDGCDMGQGGPYTEVASPRAGVGVPPGADLEADVSNMWGHRDESEICVCDTQPPANVEFEYDSGFGWEFVDFDGTTATYFHRLTVFDQDTVEVPGASNDTTVTLSSESKVLGMLCAFETFQAYDTYDRYIFLESFLIVGSDTVASETKWVERTIYVVQDSTACPDSTCDFEWGQ